MNKIIMFGGLVLMNAALHAGTPAPFQMDTSVMSVRIENGMITGIRDRKNGRVWADSSVKDTEIPSGLGILKDLDTFRKFHSRDGMFENGRALKPGFSLINYFRPCAQSDYSVQKQKDGSMKLIWKGLSNGRDFLPDAEFFMELQASADGALRIRSGGSWPQGNVYATMTAVGNIDRKAEGILPIYGGKSVRGSIQGMMTCLSKNEDMEAPLMMLTDRGETSLALWIEDPRIRDYMAYFNRTEKSHSLIFEHCNLMYFKDKTEAASPDVFLKVFQGDWKVAASPYRDYYRRQYKDDFAARSAVKWENGIGTSINLGSVMFPDEKLDMMKKFYAPGSAVIMTWNARAPGWDRELPDWTPRNKYVEGVARAHKAGFKVMSYVNICCANYLSPAWKRYGLDSFFLPSKVSLGYYGHPKMSERENKDLMNFRQFSNYKKDQLYYGDLLSLGWRKFHVGLMDEWCRITGTDALYEDCSGCGSDTGNGVIGGLAGSEGEREQLRQLRKQLPNTVFASEYLTHSNAASIHWPLKLHCCFLFSEGTRRSMLHDYRPVSAFIYGNRPWISGSRGYSPFDKHVQVSLADSVGGFGFLDEAYYRTHDEKEIEEDYSLDGHLHQRAVLFSKFNLRPYFPKGGYPKNIICMYKGTNGIYSYYDDGILQQMLGPDGKIVYARTTGSGRVKTEWHPRRWPVDESGILAGLNPEWHYVLYPKEQRKTAVTVTSIPEKCYVRQYYETGSVWHLELFSSEKDISADLRWDPKYTVLTSDGKTLKPGKIHAASPLILTGFPDQGKKTSVSVEVISLLFSGQMAAPAKPLAAFPIRKTDGKTCHELPGGHQVLVLSAKALKPEQQLEFFIQDKSSLMVHPHDGQIFRLRVDGKIIRQYDTTRGTEPEWGGGMAVRKTRFDLKSRTWNLPLKEYAGKPVLITLEIDPRNHIMGDRSLIAVTLK
ncbi:MAG: hypothetical protein IJS01_13110 [Lentisphaeria bacterium]|nr:hypothetical protein [Lentisphaeria bacterium]